MKFMQKVRVMSELEPFLRISRAYNLDNLRGSSRVVRQNIGRTVCLTAFIAMQILTTALLLWACIDERFNIQTPAMATLVIGCQLFGAEMSMIRNNGKISETIGRVQAIVDSRNVDRIFSGHSIRVHFKKKHILFEKKKLRQNQFIHFLALNGP